MRKILSSHLFLRSRLHPGLLDALARSGADGVELFAARQHFDYTSRQAVRELAEWFRDNACAPFSMHAPLSAEADTGRGAPSINVLDREKGRRIEAMDEVKRALEAAEQIPFQHMVLHLGDRSESWSNWTLEHALTAIEHLQAFARPLGVRLLLENIPNEVTAPERLLEILRVGHFDDVGICLDLGHAHMGGGVGPALETLKDRIRTAHIHDNHGERDEHLWPGEGTIDFAAAYKGLREAKQASAGVLEIHYSLGVDPTKAAEQAKAAFARFDEESE